MHTKAYLEKTPSTFYLLPSTSYFILHTSYFIMYLTHKPKVQVQVSSVSFCFCSQLNLLTYLLSTTFKFWLEAWRCLIYEYEYEYCFSMAVTMHMMMAMMIIMNEWMLKFLMKCSTELLNLRCFHFLFFLSLSHVLPLYPLISCHLSPSPLLLLSRKLPDD